MFLIGGNKINKATKSVRNPGIKNSAYKRIQKAYDKCLKDMKKYHGDLEAQIGNDFVLPVKVQFDRTQREQILSEIQKKSFSELSKEEKEMLKSINEK